MKLKVSCSYSRVRFLRLHVNNEFQPGLDCSWLQNSMYNRNNVTEISWIFSRNWLAPRRVDWPDLRPPRRYGDTQDWFSRRRRDIFFLILLLPLFLSLSFSPSLSLSSLSSSRWWRTGLCRPVFFFFRHIFNDGVRGHPFTCSILSIRPSTLGTLIACAMPYRDLSRSEDSDYSHPHPWMHRDSVQRLLEASVPRQHLS